ncbi:GNAT family N-acetyltransferase [Jiangella asiatica]|uniref:N-acetyltransferase n=1 Tax=Jiangella asiatica TaxID=2530372 RepID=A0A4R5DRM4_9ACTN|nr:GNAT family N-acetyltransferase [Jiangella asiatica]TDE13453.1 N-acetyltransferase [Jiangella asiatica]
MRIRPMRPDDVEAAERLTALAFEIERSEEHGARWCRQIAHVIDTDPGGCWVADADGETRIVGVAVSMRRDLLWLLTTYAVRPDQQGRGIGQALLDAAIGYGAGCLRGMLTSRPHHGALRRYRRAGFSLHPTMRLTGTVDRSTLPVVDGVRVGTAADLDLVDSVDRRVRGATHRLDNALLMELGTLLVCDLLTGSGYAYLTSWGVAPLAATNRAVAQRLLWEALARVEPGRAIDVRNLTSDQEWAVDVGLAAGLRLDHDAYLALRHMRPPEPYIPSVAFG